MIFQFGEYKIDVDVEKTRQFYDRAKTVSEGCQCDGCLNFERAVDKLPQNIRDFFSALGVDMKKICECYVYCAKDENTLYYGGFCHICGTLLSGKSAWKPTSDSTACWDEKATYPLSPNFGVSFSDRIDMPEPDFPLPVIQLDFDADIPWVLEKKNSYIDKGEKMDFDLTPEQAKNAKKYAKTGTKKPTVYKFDTEKAKNRKKDDEKGEFISKIAEFIGKFVQNVEIVNAEREISFEIGENSYSLTLTKHRKPKK